MTNSGIGFDEKYDVVVVGAGIGGLSCAAYLAKQGKISATAWPQGRAEGPKDCQPILSD